MKNKEVDHKALKRAGTAGATALAAATLGGVPLSKASAVYGYYPEIVLVHKGELKKEPMTFLSKGTTYTVTTDFIDVGYNQLGKTPGYDGGVYYTSNNPGVKASFADGKVELIVLDNATRDWIIRVADDFEGEIPTVYFTTEQSTNNVYASIDLNGNDNYRVINNGTKDDTPAGFRDYFIGDGTLKGGSMQSLYFRGAVESDRETFEFLGLRQQIKYYAVCQLWNDLVWGADGFGLKPGDFGREDWGYYNHTTGESRSILPAEIRGVNEDRETPGMMPVGLFHRDALVDYWYPNPEDRVGNYLNVRYVPLSPTIETVNEDGTVVFNFDQWTDNILYGMDGRYVGLYEAFGELGILPGEVDEFIASYDWPDFVDHHDLLRADDNLENYVAFFPKIDKYKV